MKSQFLSPLITENLIDGRFVRLHKPFKYFSAILNHGVEIPARFICDYESVPFFKASSKRGGVIHDYFSRKDSVPVVTKQMAASLYLEAQKCRDEMLGEGFFKRLDRAIRRNIKTWVVRIAWGYFHKLNVLSPIEDFVK